MKSLLSLLFILLSIDVFASTCILPELEAELKCSGNFRARSMEDLNEYLNDFKNDGFGTAKNLIIDFDLDVGSFDIKSPCNIRFTKNRVVNSSGKLCLYGKEGVRVNPFSNFNFVELEIYTEKKAVFRNNSNISGSSLVIKSLKEGENSRVHIRHSSEVKLDKLVLEASSRATLGHSSSYKVKDKIVLTTKGSQGKIYLNEFSAVWKNTEIETENFEINSHRLAKISSGVKFGTSGVKVISPRCVVHKSVVFPLLCNSIITPKLKGPREVIEGTKVVFSAKKTRSENQIKSISYLIDNKLYENTGDVFEYTFSESGVFHVLLIVEDVLGNIVTKSRKIKVLKNTENGELRAHFYFLKESDTSIMTVLVPRLGDTELKEAYYLFEDGTKLNLENKLYGSLKEINLEGKEKVTLFIEDMEGNKSNFSHVVDMSNLTPYLGLDIYNKGNRNFVFDINRSFDPLESVEYVEIDYGDGNQQTFEDIDVNSFQVLEHTYLKEGKYEGSISYVVSRGDEEVVINKQFELLTSQPVDYLKLVRFKLAKDPYINHVTINFDNSVLINDKVVGVRWDYGDGTFSTTTEEHSHFYEPGTYEVKLTVFFDDGTSKASKQLVTIYEAGEDLVASIQCWDEGDRYVSCYSTLADKHGRLNYAIVDWGDSVERIDLSDGYYSPIDIEHRFEAEGEKTISLTVFNSLGESQIVTTKVSPQGERDVRLLCSGEDLVLECNVVASPAIAGKIKSIEVFGNNQIIHKSSDVFIFSKVYENEVSLNLFAKIILTTGEMFDTEPVSISLTGKYNTPPSVAFACESSGLSLSCDSSETFDMDSDTLYFKWLVNGELVSEDSVMNFLSVGAQEVEVELIVTDNKDTGNLIKKVKLTNNPEDIITINLFCQKITLVRQDCSVKSSQGKITNIVWFLDGNKVEESGQSIVLDNLDNPLYQLKVVASNEVFSEEKSLTLDMVKIDPQLELNWKYDKLGNVNIFAEFVNSGAIANKYVWRIEGESFEYTSLNNEITFKNEFVDGKRVIAYAEDGSGKKLESEILIDLTSDNSPPIVVVDYIQPKGKASREVEFDAGKSFDNNGSIVDYLWVIDGKEFRGPSLSYTFPSRGEKQVKLIVTDDLGLISEKSFSFTIEEINVFHIKSEYKEFSFNTIKLDNYIPDVLKISLANEELTSKRKGEQSIFFVPHKSDSGELILDFDGDLATFDVVITKREIIKNPKRHILNKIENEIDSTQNLNDEALFSNLTQVKIELNKILSEYSEDELQTVAYLVDELENKKLKSKPTEEVTFNILNKFFPVAYASTISDTDNSRLARECIGTFNNIEESFLTFDLVGVVLTALISAKVGPAGLAVFSFYKLIAFFVEKGLVERNIQNCVSNVLIPDAYNGFSYQFQPGVEVDSGKAKVFSGVTYDIDLSVRGVGFGLFSDLVSEGKVTSKPWFYTKTANTIGLYLDLPKKIKEAEELARKSRDEILETKANTSTVVDAFNKLIELLVGYKFEERMQNYLLNGFNSNTVENIRITSGSLVTLKVEDQEYIGLNHRGGKIVFSSTVNRDVTTTMGIYKGKYKELYYPDLNRKVLDKFVVTRRCSDNSLIKHINTSLFDIFEGGYKSVNANVGDNVILSNGAVVCDDANISGNVEIYNAMVRGSGTVISHSGNSTLRISGNVSVGEVRDDTVILSTGGVNPFITATEDKDSVVISGSSRLSLTKGSSILASGGGSKIQLHNVFKNEGVTRAYYGGQILVVGGTTESVKLNNSELRIYTSNHDLEISGTSEVLNSWLSVSNKSLGGIEVKNSEILNTDGERMAVLNEVSQFSSGAGKLYVSNSKIVYSGNDEKKGMNFSGEIIGSKRLVNVGMSGNISIQGDPDISNVSLSGSIFVNENSTKMIDSEVIGRVRIFGANIERSTLYGSPSIVLSRNVVVSDSGIYGSPKINGTLKLSGQSILSGEVEIVGEVNISGMSSVSCQKVGPAEFVNGHCSDEAIIKDNAVISGSTVKENAIVSRTEVIAGSTIGGRAEVSDGTIYGSEVFDVTLNSLKNISDSTISGGSIGSSLELTGASNVTGGSIGDSVTIKNGSNVSGGTVQSGATISKTSVSGTANVGDKSGKSCDGIDDSEPEDPCVKNEDTSS